MEERYEEWGVRYNGDGPIRSMGQGYWAMKHAEQEVERTTHNATLPSVGQPKSATVVKREVVKTFEAKDWIET